MTFRLEHKPADHTAVLVEMMNTFHNKNPDVYIVSKEGHKIFTHKLLLCFYSSSLGGLLNSHPGTSYNIDGISVPSSSNSIVYLIKVLMTGKTFSSNKSELLAVSETAEVLGINIKNLKIGFRIKMFKKENNAEKNVEKREIMELNDSNFMKTEGNNDPLLHLKKEDGCKQHFGRKTKTQRAQTNTTDRYPCNICPSTFSRKDSVIMHMKAVHESKFKCDQCGKVLTSKEILKRHLKIHTGITFPCNLCTWITRRKDNLTRHMKKKHFHAISNQSELNELKKDDDETPTSQMTARKIGEYAVDEFITGDKNEDECKQVEENC